MKHGEGAPESLLPMGTERPCYVTTNTPCQLGIFKNILTFRFQMVLIQTLSMINVKLPSYDNNYYQLILSLPVNCASLSILVIILFRLTGFLPVFDNHCYHHDYKLILS